MYYYLYRFYDPNLQRWINRDPLDDRRDSFQRAPERHVEELVNLYAFIRNSPIGSVDFLGLSGRRVWTKSRNCTPKEVEQCFWDCFPRKANPFCWNVFEGDPNNPQFIGTGSNCNCGDWPRPPIPLPIPLPEPRPRFAPPKPPFTPIFQCH
jgi:RHS repeat-associated protein